MVSKDKNKVLKYSIKKFSVGTFSVMVGAFIFLATPALASETNSENIHKENSTIIEKEKPKETYKNEVNIANETSNVEKNVSNNAKENYSVEKKSNPIEEKNPEDTTVLGSGEKVYSTEKNGDSIEEKSSVEKTVAEKTKSRRKRSINSEIESAKRFATNEDFEKISKGLITTEDGKIDNLLFGKTPLKANEDSDGDDAQNGSEIYIYEKDGKTYYGYYGHPFLKDTDGDGIPDNDHSDLNKPADDDNFKWYVTDRDMVMFMKLAYRDDEYIKKVLNRDYKWTNADNIVKDDSRAKNEYELMHNELSSYWEVDKTYHYDSGLDAVIFKTKSTFPFLPDGLVHVLAIRGTHGSKDVQNDAVIGLGQDPRQGWEIEEIIKDIGKREDIKNFYITGHSLGGYLTQRAVVKLHRLANEENGNYIDSIAEKYKNFYNNIFKKATTFNAPKINASILNRNLYNKSILSKKLAKQGKIKHYGMSKDRVIGLLYNDKDVLTYIDGGSHSSNSYFSALLNDDDNFNIGERTGVSGKGKQNPVLKDLKIAEPTDEEVRKIVNENIKISLKDQNPVEILALNKISREEVLKKLNLDNLPNTATLNINVPDEVQSTAGNHVLPVTISYLGKTVDPNINVVVKVLPNFEELKAIKQKASDEKEKRVDTEHKTAETKNYYDAKKVELDTKLQKVEELLNNSSAKQSEIKDLTKELETLLEEYKTSVSGLKLDKTLLTDEIAKAANKLEMFKNTDTSLKPVEVATEFNSQKDKLLNNYNNLLKEVKDNLDKIETYDKLVEEKNRLANLENEIQEASFILNKTQKDYYEPIKKSYELYEGDKPNEELSIEKNNLPIKNIIWEIKPNTSSSGNKEGRVKVIYNDDSFDLVDVNVNVKALYGEIITTTKEEKLPLKVTYTGDETKDYGYISEFTGKDGKVVTTIKSRLNKKTNVVEEMSRTSVRTEATNTVIIKGTKSKIEEIKIPKEVIYEEDASLDKGKEFVKTEGEDGKNITTTTYVLNSKTGEITEKVTVEKEEKTDKIIVRGTKQVVSEPEIIEVPTNPKDNSNEDSVLVQPGTPAKQETPTAPSEEKPKEDKPSVPEVLEYIDPVGTSSMAGEGNLITPPTVEVPEYTDPVGTSSTDGEGNLITLPIAEVPEYTDPVGTSSTDGEGNLITPATAEVPEYTDPVGTNSTDGKGNLITSATAEIPEYTDPVGTNSTDGKGNLITPATAEVPEYTDPVGTSSIAGEGNLITPPTVEVPEYTDPVGTSSTDGEGNLITPPTVEVPEYTDPVGTSSMDGEGNLITPATAEVPEYTDPVGTSSMAGEGNLITPPTVEVPEYTDPVGTSSTDGEGNLITPSTSEVSEYTDPVGTSSTDGEGNLIPPPTAEVPEYTDPVGTSSTDGEGNLITPPTVEVPEYTDPVGTSSTDGEGNLITPSTAEVPEYTDPVGTSSTGGEGNLITPPTAEVPEYTDPVGTSSTDGEGNLITPPTVEIPEFNGGIAATDSPINKGAKYSEVLSTKVTKRLANTGETNTNTELAGLGILGGLLAAARRRKNDKN